VSTPQGWDHDAIEELLGAFALDAVDEDERLAVEDHLRECPRCRDEVRQHREAAAPLAFAGAPAPEGLWNRIVAELEPAIPEPELGRLYPLQGRRAQQRWIVVPATAAAVLIILVGVLGWELHDQSHRIHDINAAIGAQGLDQAVADAALDPHSAKATLLSADRRVQLQAVIGPDGSGYLVPAPGDGLPPLPATQTYQLWAVVGSQKISMGLLGNHPNQVVAFHASAPAIDALAITSERAGGVLESTHAPVVAGSFSVPPSTTAS
jgi:anti-sigma factor RsiW